MVANNRSFQVFDLSERMKFRSQRDHKATILFATDLTPSSRVGLRWATSLAQSCRGRILLLHVQSPADCAPFELYHDFTKARHRLEVTLRSLLPTDPTIRADYQIKAGDPARRILDVAESENANLIVLGTHQRRGLQRLMKGSVTESVLRQAPCPVFVFRQTG
jgi:nucleotide-binding universal stress UspA family protein